MRHWGPAADRQRLKEARVRLTVDYPLLEPVQTTARPHSTSVFLHSCISRRTTRLYTVIPPKLSAGFPIHQSPSMAAFAPPQSSTSRPLPTDFTPSSPPDQPFYVMHTGLPDPLLAPPVDGSNRMQHRSSTDLKTNGHTAGFANGAGGMPVPNNLQHPIPNGASKHRGTVSMGAFDAPRSPPSTKSMLHRSSAVQGSRKADMPAQIPRTFLANSSEQANARLGRHAHSHTRLTSRPSIPLANTSLRYLRNLPGRLDH